MDIELTTHPSAADAQALSDGIVNFNRNAVPDLEPVEAELRFCILVRDGAGTVVGGLRASCFWNTLHIELLWLSEHCRGAGVGRRILLSAEAFAHRHGCEKALVETTSWQARPFYERCGYRHMATLPDRPRGHASHYLCKTLGADSRAAIPGP
ncbi:MAG: GNAT family N-acetyltransferase [Nevskiales bacterium]|nr:GNAT family N-acetyltransferase [Nevskiales bacterium]